MKSKNDTSSLIPADPASLPDDVATLKEMVAHLLGDLAKEQSLVEHLQQQLEQQLRNRYGRKSEKINWEGGLFSKEELEELFKASQEEAPEKETVTYQRQKPKRKGHGRQEIPDHLPRKREEVDVPAAEKNCSVCDTEKIRIGEEVSEQLEYVPASLFVKQTVRPVYACPNEHEVTTALMPPMPIEKGLAGPGLLSQVAVSKYGDHLPLNRQEEMFSRHGVKIPRSTQCDWMRQIADLLDPLLDLLKATILASQIVATDDTPVPVQEKQKTRKGRHWVYYDPVRKLAIFDYTPKRTRDGPVSFLGDFAGYLQADAYVGYDAIYAGKTVIEVACWAHARRKFEQAQSAQPQIAVAAMAWIKQLYDVEREAKAEVKRLDLDDDQRRAALVARRYELRQEKAIPLLAAFDAWLTEKEASVLPKSPAGKAIHYVRANWTALNRYVEDGWLEIDNNTAERAMRHIAVGRKNWLFAGSDRGGQTGASITSLLYSAKLHNLNLWAYLTDVLQRIPTTPISQLEQFLPDVWAREHAPKPDTEASESNQNLH